MGILFKRRVDLRLKARGNALTESKETRTVVFAEKVLCLY